MSGRGDRNTKKNKQQNKKIALDGVIEVCTREGRRLRSE